MAIFGKKKGGDGAEDTGPNGDQAPDSGFNPATARKFFDRAQTLHDSTNYEYSMHHWLVGLRWDPTSMDGLRGFLRTSDAFLSEHPKGKVSKETRAAVETKGAVGKYIDALLTFGVKKMDTAAAVRVAGAAADIGVHEAAQFLGRHALAIAKQDDKKKKDTFVKLLDVLDKSGDYQAAAQAGEMACQLDPADGQLQNRVRNMMAQATMNRGGFDESGQEGGFRRNIRDAEKQAQLEQSEMISKTASTKDAIVERTKAAHEANPDDVPALEAYAKALVERGKHADVLKAMSVYSQAHSKTGQFRFRQRSGELQLRLAKRSVVALRQQAEANPGDEAAKEKFESALASYRQKELEELRLQVENYPTDLPLKFELGKRYFEQGMFDEAIEQFQQAQEDAKLRRQVQGMMGQSLLRLGGWEGEAVATYRQALDGLTDLDSDQGMDLRYGLMCALRAYAEKDRDLDAAKEAEKLAGGIAIKSFTYRDIREQRDAIKQLVKGLEGGG